MLQNEVEMVTEKCTKSNMIIIIIKSLQEPITTFWRSGRGGCICPGNALCPQAAACTRPCTLKWKTAKKWGKHPKAGRHLAPAMGGVGGGGSPQGGGCVPSACADPEVMGGGCSELPQYNI